MTPDRFYRDMVSLANESPNDAGEVASVWRNRFLNMAEDSKSAVRTGLEVASGAVVGFGFGLLGGRWKAQDDDIMEDWKNGGYAAAGLASWRDGSPYSEGHAKLPDRYPSMKPGTLFGVPITLLVTIGLGAAAVFKIGGEYNSLLAQGATAGVVYWTAQAGEMVGYDWQMSAIEAADQEAGQAEAA